MTPPPNDQTQLSADPATATLLAVTELRAEVQATLRRLEQHDGDIIAMRRQLNEQAASVAVLQSQQRSAEIEAVRLDAAVKLVAARKTVSPTAVYSVLGLIFAALAALVPVLIAALGR